MDIKEILNSIPELTRDIVENKLISIEDICCEHPMLTQDNPLTYMIFLDRRKDLCTEDRNNIYKIIKRLHENKRLLLENEQKEYEESVKKSQIDLENNVVDEDEKPVKVYKKK